MFKSAKESRQLALHATGAALAATIAAVFFQGMYAPMRTDIDSRSERIALVRSLMSGADRITENHQAMQARLDALTAAAEATRERMPTDVSAGEFLGQCTRMAEAIGLTVDECQAGVPQLYATHATIDVSCRMTGSFASICQYLAAIDQLPQIVKLSRLDLARSDESGTYPAQVTFQLYYQLDPHDKDNQRGTL